MVEICVTRKCKLYEDFSEMNKTSSKKYKKYWVNLSQSATRWYNLRAGYFFFALSQKLMDIENHAFLCETKLLQEAFLITSSPLS